MTPSEKRAFRIASRTHGDQTKAYVRLFDLVEAATEAPPADLADQMKGIATPESIPVLRSYLYQQILRTIRERSSDRSPGIAVWLLIEEARILFRKGLNDDARDYLSKARVRAERWEMHAQLQEIESLEANLSSRNDDAATQLDSFEERERQHAAHGELLRLNHVVGRLSAELHLGPALPDSPDRRRFDTILEELPEEPPPESAYRRRSSWHYARATHAFGTYDLDRALVETEALIAHFTSDPRRVDEAPEELFRQVNNRLLLLQRMGREEEFLAVLAETRTEFATILSSRRQGDELTRISAAGTLWMREAIFCVEREQYERLVGIAEEIDAELSPDVRQEQSVFWAILFHICAIGQTMVGDVRTALRWNTRTLDIEIPDRPEIMFAPRALQIILHHKLGNATLVSSLLRRLPREAPEGEHFAEAGEAIIEFVRAYVLRSRTKRSQNRLQRAVEGIDRLLSGRRGAVLIGHVPFGRMAGE